MFLIYDGRESFYQWDLDRKLIVKDSTIKEVHFCNRTDECSLVCETYVEDGLTLVNVPNILLQQDWKINVYAYDSTYTKFSKRFDVIKRSKPANYIYTETEVKRWEDLEERIVYLEENGTGSGGGSNIKIDTTLTVEGAAADAKVVGEKFDYLRKYNGWIDTQTGVYIDTSAKTLTFGANTYITYGNQLHNVSNTTHDISTMIGGAWVYLDVSKQPYTLTKNRNTQYTVLLGALWKPNHLADFHMDKTKLYVDGMPITYVGRYSGKTINCLGDSMTEGVGTTKAYHQWFGQLCGFKNIKVYGLGGSSITPIGSHEPAWTGEESILSFYERYSDMGDADAISVMGCVNDWATGRELGRITDTTTDTFYGTMKLLCEGLIAKYPTKDIYFFSSPQTDYIHRPANKIAGTNWAGNIEGYNRKGYKLEDYSRAMGEVCAIYGIPFMSLTNNCYWGLSGVLGEYQNDAVNGVYGSDSLHPNAEGHKRIALKMSSVINNGYGSGAIGNSGNSEEEWELINDITVEEDISAIDTGYWDIPYKKLRVVADTLAAETKTNYSPVRVWMENDNSANQPTYDVTSQWYPPAIPTTSAKQSVWEISTEYLGEDIFVIFDSMNKGEVDKLVFVNPTEIYYNQKATNKIYRLSINTYGTFVTGTRFRVWGVRV